MKKIKNWWLVVLAIFVFTVFAFRLNNAMANEMDFLSGYGQYSTTINEKTFEVKGQKVQCQADCLVYNEHISTGNRHHIVEILGITQATPFSSAFELRDLDTAVNFDPVTKSYRIQCVGVLEITKDDAKSAKISYKELEKEGFTMSGSRDTKWVASYSYSQYIEI